MFSDNSNSKSRLYKKELKNFVGLQIGFFLIKLELQAGVTRKRRAELNLELKTHSRKIYDKKPVFRDLFDRKKITEYTYLLFIADFMNHVCEYEKNITILCRVLKAMYNELTELGELADKKAKALLKN